MIHRHQVAFIWEYNVIQYIQTNKCNISHEQTKGQKSHDPFNRWFANLSSWLKTIKNLEKSSIPHIKLIKTAPPACNKWWTGIESISFKIKNETRILTFFTVVEHNDQRLSQSNRTKEGNIRHTKKGKKPNHHYRRQ